MVNPAQWRGMKYPDSEVVALVYRHARPSSPNACAIDVGCAAGRHLKFLCDMGYDAYGIDNDPQMIQDAENNGLTALHTDAGSHVPEEPLELALCWGFMMLLEHGASLIATWKPGNIIANWRTLGNSFVHWPETIKLSEKKYHIKKAGHVLNDQIYYCYGLEDCNIPGYTRTHWQKHTQENAAETNEWYQTVHVRD